MKTKRESGAEQEQEYQIDREYPAPGTKRSCSLIGYEERDNDEEEWIKNYMHLVLIGYMEKNIIKVGEQGRITLPKALRIAEDLTKGCFATLEIKKLEFKEEENE